MAYHTYHTKVMIKFTTHTAHVTVDEEGTVHVFKYSNRTCDFGVFNRHEQMEASDFILTGLSDTHFRVVFPGELPE